MNDLALELAAEIASAADLSKAYSLLMRLHDVPHDKQVFELAIRSIRQLAERLRSIDVSQLRVAHQAMDAAQLVISSSRPWTLAIAPPASL